MNPLSAIYAAGVRTRNGLYDRGVLKAHRLSAPVVSVGNISVGGSGKTPFVILLGGLLKERGVAFDVLSRGYGRKTRGVLAVDPDGSPRDFGDEPILIAKRLGCPVIVGENRYQAGLFAESKFGVQTAHSGRRLSAPLAGARFRHRPVSPEDAHDQLLPTGRLREPLSSLRRASAVVISAEADPSPLKLNAQPIWRIRRGVTVEDAPPNPVVFCGIARPQKFIEQLSAIGIEPMATKFYRDHHSYKEEDVREIASLRQQHHAGGFITTEKDVINLGPQLPSLGPVAVARVVMELLNPADALDTILRVIRRTQATAVRKSLWEIASL